MPDPKVRTPRKKPAARKPIAKPEEAVVPGEVVEEHDTGLSIQLIQRSFDQSDVELRHVILGGQDPTVLVTVDFDLTRTVTVDSTLMTVADLRNLFLTIADALGKAPEKVSDKPFI